MWKNAVPLVLVLMFVGLVVHRIWRSTELDPDIRMGASVRLGEEAERALYLVPAGKYTQEDIEANGPLLPSERYRGFQARHDFNPAVGDRLCPISRTKANSTCTWIIDGQTYEFCCPPCIDELVRLAKEQPDALQASDNYVKE
jgi:hypothetical protein